MPDTVTVFFYYYYTLVASIYAEVVPVRVIEEVVKLEQAEFLVEFLECLPEDCDFLTLEVAFLDDAVHLEVLFLVLKR